MSLERGFPRILLALLALLSVPCFAQESEPRDDPKPRGSNFAREYTFSNDEEPHAHHDLLSRVGPYFKAKVQGKTVCALLDSGATQTLLSDKAALQFGIPSEKPLGFMRTLNGIVPRSLSGPVRVEVPGQFSFESPVVLGPVPQLPCTKDEDLPLSLIIGMDVMKVMSVLIDRPGNRITFRPSGELLPTNRIARRIDWIDRYIQVQIEERGIPMVVDTGLAVPFLLPPTLFDQLSEGKETKGGISLSTAGGEITDMRSIPDLPFRIYLPEIGKYAEVSAEAVRAETDGDTRPALIGFSMFVYVEALFDAANDAIYLIRDRRPDD